MTTLILAAIVFFLEILLGYKIVSLFKLDVKFIERFLYSLVSGFMVCNTLLFVSYLFFGLNVFSILLPLALIIILIRDMLMDFLKGNTIEPNKLRKNISKTIKINLYVIVFSLGLLVFFSYISYTHLLQPKDDGLYSAGYTWADLPFHTGIINSFVENTNRRLEYPFYVGIPLHYHFMVDFSTAVLITGGLPLREALFLVNTPLLFSTFLLFFFFARRIVKNQNIALFAIILFVFTGGLGFIHFINESRSLGMQVSRDYTAYPEKGIHFGNPLTDALFPQRGYLIGYPALFIVLSILWRNLTERFNRRELAFAGLIVGLLPLFHLYAFFSAVFIYFLLFAVYFHKDRKKLLGTWPFFAISGILALPQMYWYFHKISVGFVRFYLGWLVPTANTNWLEFWVLNLGLIFILALPSYIAAPLNLKKFAIPFIGLFIIGNTFMLQPNGHYNITLFYIWNIVNTIIISFFLYKLFEKGNIYKFAVIGIVILSIFSGFLSLAWEAQSSWREFSNEEVEMAEWVKQNTSQDAIFLTSTAHNHFVHSLTGRRILMGYRGSLWSHAIDYGQREKDVASMFVGNFYSIELLKKYGVDYVVIGPGERSEFSANESFFDDNSQLVKESASYKIFKV